ncbi:MAG TPA: VWA domain-containing protein [Candidatus Acidoferrales bacterium]|nr:VWA domain-containing protein [Candidatus Acidoferrales bacterium]
MRTHRSLRCSLCLALAIFSICGILEPLALSRAQSKQSRRRKEPQELDKGIVWRRDETGELRILSAPGSTPPGAANSPGFPEAIRTWTQVVPVTCVVSTADGTPVPGLRREDFRVFESGFVQRISYFDASTQPASVALILDASPSVLPDAAEMRDAADALVDALAPLDRAAVVDFSAHTYLLLPFSDVREEVRRAVDRVNARQLLADTGGSNIYEAVYLAARELFHGGTGRKAIVLLTDGQDSGLGLTYDPASAMPRPDHPDALSFDDVARMLAAEDIQLFAVSTENRPKIMTPAWLDEHQGGTLVTPAARTLGVPAYTLYLAELVRRAGGQLYFLNEASTAADTFRKIAGTIRAEYTLGFYPALGATAPGNRPDMPLLPVEVPDERPGWHPLSVEVPDDPGLRVAHRAAYYVSGRLE